MKVLSYLSLIVGMGALAAGFYLVLVIVPKAESLESMMFNDDPYGFYDSVQPDILGALEMKTNLALAVLCSGALAVLLAILPIIKKHKVAWVGALAGLVSALIGALYGTHMFS